MIESSGNETSFAFERLSLASDSNDKPLIRMTINQNTH